MDMKDICNAGGDILDAVADAINRNDYTGLSDHVSTTVDRVVKQVREEVGKGTYGNPTHQYGKTTYTRQGQANYQSVNGQNKYSSIYHNWRRNAAANTRQQPQQYGMSRKEREKLPATITNRPAGRISGPIQFAWGILATSGFGITALVMTIMMATSSSTVFTVLAAVFGLLTALSVIDIVRGSRKIGLVNRFYRYARLIGNRGFIAVEELAYQTGQKKEDVLRDLKSMMKKHMFLQGRLDRKQTTFMLTQEAYQQYLLAEQGRIDRETDIQNVQKAYRMQEKERTQNKAYGESQMADQDPNTKKILQDGNAYIQMVHECSEKIQKEEMTYKLSKLEAIMRRIFEQVEKAPDSADDLHKFMDYYLPTTTKLLHAYIDLDRQGISGENIAATKKEIEDTLDTINVAFEKLLDSLFEDTAWDISSDISVMKTMMAQEGLTGGEDFKVKKP